MIWCQCKFYHDSCLVQCIEWAQIYLIKVDDHHISRVVYCCVVHVAIDLTGATDTQSVVLELSHKVLRLHTCEDSQESLYRVTWNFTVKVIHRCRTFKKLHQHVKVRNYMLCAPQVSRFANHHEEPHLCRHTASLTTYIHVVLLSFGKL